MRANGWPGAVALGALVLVVREDQVEAAAVDVELLAELAHRHGGALDVPARPAVAPTGWATSCPRRPCAPSRARSRAATPCPRPARSGPPPAGSPVRWPERRAVLLEGADPEVDVAVRRVGEAAPDEPLDQRDDLRHRLRHARLAVGAPEAQAAGVVDVRLRHLRRDLARSGGRRSCATSSIFSLTSVMLMTTRGRRSAWRRSRWRLQRHGDDVRPRVADVDVRVDRRAAAVDGQPAGLHGLDRARLSIRLS